MLRVEAGGIANGKALSSLRPAAKEGQAPMPASQKEPGLQQINQSGAPSLLSDESRSSCDGSIGTVAGKVQVSTPMTMHESTTQEVEKSSDAEHEVVDTSGLV